jgi:hypothetical protein
MILEQFSHMGQRRIQPHSQGTKLRRIYNRTNTFNFFAASHTESSFDNIYSGITFPSTFVHHLDTLAEIARILKPSGSLILRQPTG